MPDPLPHHPFRVPRLARFRNPQMAYLALREDIDRAGGRNYDRRKRNRRLDHHEIRALVVSGGVSVGLNAVAVVNARNR
jgi:hypothetical protein